MTDEKFCFISDVREKKSIGRGAYHKRSHAGKGGAVKFPSDYMTKKELKAMNGETKSYNINEPMKWKEFKAMPDYIKAIYIKAIREKYRATNLDIGKMLGINKVSFSKEIARLGLKGGEHTRGNNEGFWRWVNGVPAQEEACCGHCSCVQSVPVAGRMDFKGDASAALETMKKLLRDSNVMLDVRWRVIEDE